MVSVPCKINTLIGPLNKSDFVIFITSLLSRGHQISYLDDARDSFFVSWACIILLTLLPHSPVFTAFLNISSYIDYPYERRDRTQYFYLISAIVGFRNDH